MYTLRLDNSSVCFAKEGNIVLQRYKFYTQPKLQHESIDEFVSQLRTLSVKCKFGQMTNELIRDQLIVQCKDRKIQECLWAAKNPNLKEAIDMAKVIEQSQMCMRELNKQDSANNTATVRLSNSPSRDVDSVNRLPNKAGQKKIPPPSLRKCFRCGDPSHNADNRSCPAVDKNCHKCGRRGHFMSVCRSTAKTRIASVSNDWETPNMYNGNSVDQTVNEFRERILWVEVATTNMSDMRYRPRPTATFNVNDKLVDLMVDSGSMYTIIPAPMHQQNWPKVALFPKDIDPCGYQGQSIQLLGFMKKCIRFEERHIFGKVYVATDGPPILGWMHQYDLNIMICPRGPRTVMSVQGITLDEVLLESGGVFDDKLGLLKGMSIRLF